MAGDPPAKKDFFISYNKADREWAEWIAQQLEQVGNYSVVIQAWDFRPGGNFVLDMHRALQTCDRTLAVFSPDYLTSVFTAPEWSAVFVEDSTGLKQKLVPVRVRDCKLDGLLASIVYIDLLNLNAEKAGKALLAGVDRGPVDRKAPRPFPGMANAAVHAQPRPPGMLPDIWNVPHLRNPSFTEPGEHLIELRDALNSGRRAALAGLGGGGKTQLAVEYAYRHAGDYAIVWWLRAEQTATLASDFAALAAELDLPEKDAQEQPTIIAAVRDALRSRPDWLLVFDNANTPEEIRNYLPAAGGHVLITSRFAAWGSVAQPVEVKKWPPEVAIEFLLKRTGQADAVVAAEIAGELDYLPLALEQAAAYIESAASTLASYLALFQNHKFELLKRGTAGGDYPATVATTWEVSFTQLEKESSLGATLLNVCAFLVPDDIPRDLIARAFPDTNPLELEDAVAAILRYSLIETGEAALYLHRLVQAVIQGRLGGEGARMFAEIALRVVDLAFPDGADVTRWKECDRLLPHALFTTSLANGLGVGLDIAAGLMNRTGIYLSKRAEYEGAKTMFELALAIDEKRYGPDHPEVATGLNNVGYVLHDLGDLPGAKAAYEQALEIKEKHFGPDDPRITEVVSNIGNILRDLGDLPGSKAAHERALRIDEKAFGPEDSRVTRSLNNLGATLHDLGDLPGAKAAYERALRINERILGPEHPDVASITSNLGTVLQALGDLSGAKAACERALEIDEKVFGPDHPQVAFHANNLADVLRSLGDLPGAKTAFERALGIFQAVLGPEHTNVATVSSNLAIILQDLGDLPGAKTAFERALAIYRKSLGDDHPTTNLLREKLEFLSM